MADIPERQRQRADFLVALLDTPEAKRLQKQFGITDHNYLKRLQTNLRERASIADAPRPGRDRKYTDEVLAQAMDHMLEAEECVWSMHAAVEGMVAAGILPADTNVQSFWAVFAPYMAGQELRLVYGAQRLTFAMNSHHASQRLAWCREHQGTITTTTVRDYWFTDEIQFEYGPPPNSKWGLGLVCASQHLCPSSPCIRGPGSAAVAWLSSALQRASKHVACICKLCARAPGCAIGTGAIWSYKRWPQPICNSALH